ncbi:MAG TPA: hypothetical protein EYH34_03650 [Planctomycetes bacterium]|nr:hypothetical protein [Planctomycetota bacterium]
MTIFQTVRNWQAAPELLRRHRYGVIDAADGRLRRVVLRPIPMWPLPPELRLAGWCYHRYWPADRCRIYYNQPRRFPQFLAVPYILSGQGTRWATVRRALEALEYIARLKGVDALLCDVANRRISAKIMARWGWEPHCPSRWHRHFIKRFYSREPLEHTPPPAVPSAGQAAQST